MNSNRNLGNRLRHRTWIVVLLTLFALLPMRGVAEDPNVAAAVKAVQGKWVRQQQTPQGLIRIVKIHQGNKTVVTA